MTILAVVAAVVACLWLVSRIATILIDRAFPPVGRMLGIGGLRVHALDLPAAADAPVLLLIHGASGNLRDPVEALRKALGDRLRLVAIDRPGHGHTERGGRGMSDPARQADLLAASLDQLGIEACLLLGHSWGAAVAAAFAQRHPARVEGLVFVAPASHPWPGPLAIRTRIFATPYLGRLLAELVLVPIGLCLAGAALRSIFDPDSVPPAFARKIGALLAIRPKTYVANCRDIVDLYAHLVRLSARYDEIRAPTEIVTGNRDEIVSPEIHAYGLARDIPGARLTILSGAGHMPHWSRTDEVVAAIERVAENARFRSSRPGR